MTRPVWIILGTACCAASVAAAQTDCVRVTDPRGDARIRRTDHGNDGALHPDQRLPDLLSASLCGWEAFDASSDPYSGFSVDADDAHLFRLDLQFAGLLNPPGKVLGNAPNPFAFGNSPLIGFFDIDVDHKNSGGELGAAAEVRYLANIARFGRIPPDSLGERAARSRSDLDNSFYTPPQYERTGADFALVLCGCSQPTIKSEGGNGNGVFEAGETWVVRGRLFERSQGYLEASAAYGGSAPGLYDPFVDVRFAHATGDDTTTVTLVWAMDMSGAADLAGQSEQQVDLNVANHVSVVEALQDIIDGADAGGFSGPGWELVERWEGRDPDDGLELDEWAITGLFGAPYLSQSDGDYVWTDTVLWSDDGQEELFGDCNGDGFANGFDEQVIRDAVYASDGSGSDADGSRNGRWVLVDPGWNFSLYDLNGDMVVDIDDIGSLRPLGDFNWDGSVNTQDFIAFLNAWVARDQRADVTLNGVIDTIDFVAFLNAWVGG